MPAALPGLTKEQLIRQKKLANKLVALEKLRASIPTVKLGSAEHKIAKERMVYLLIQEQEKVAYALIRKAKSGDVRAITEFFDRIYGKAKETIDMNATTTFSLKVLAQQRAKLTDTLMETIDAEILPEGISAHGEEIEGA